MPARKTTPQGSGRRRRPKTPSSRLWELRVGSDLSQQALADRTGLTRETIARIEAGGQEPTVSTALALAKAFDTTVEALFGGES